MAKQFETLKELPELPGWLTFPEAAAELGISGERFRQMAQEGKLKTAHRIGRRPVGIVQESEILEIAAERQADLERQYREGRARTEALRGRR